MSDNNQEKPVVDSKPTEELSPEELNRVNGGNIFPSIIKAVTEEPGVVVTGTIGSPRDASAGLPTGKRM